MKLALILSVVAAVPMKISDCNSGGRPNQTHGLNWVCVARPFVGVLECERRSDFVGAFAAAGRNGWVGTELDKVHSRHNMTDGAWIPGRDTLISCGATGEWLGDVSSVLQLQQSDTVASVYQANAQQAQSVLQRCKDAVIQSPGLGEGLPSPGSGSDTYDQAVLKVRSATDTAVETCDEVSGVDGSVAAEGAIWTAIGIGIAAVDLAVNIADFIRSSSASAPDSSSEPRVTESRSTHSFASGNTVVETTNTVRTEETTKKSSDGSTTTTNTKTTTEDTKTATKNSDGSTTERTETKSKEETTTTTKSGDGSTTTSSSTKDTTSKSTTTTDSQGNSQSATETTTTTTETDSSGKSTTSTTRSNTQRPPPVPSGCDFADCASTCEERARWWSDFRARCDAIGWQTYDCSSYVAAGTACADPGEVMPLPDGQIACSRPADSATIQRVRQSFCEARNGLMSPPDASGSAYCSIPKPDLPGFDFRPCGDPRAITFEDQCMFEVPFP